MKSVITFLLPGIGQVFSGDARKGGIMFISAVILAPLTSGVGYFACGAWSVFDLKTRASPSAAPPASRSSVSDTARLLTTTEVPAAAGGGFFHSVMPWLFKFTVLGLCAVLVLSNVRSGGALQSLEAFGVKLSFASLAREAEGGTSAEASGDAVAREAAFAAVANAYLSEQSGVAETAGGGSGGSSASVAHPDGSPSSPRSTLPVFSGQWKSDLGATYQIQEVDGFVRIIETSRILFVPFVSMTCEGPRSGEYVRAECRTLDEYGGELVLARDPAGGLGGIFTSYANGMQIPVNLRP